MVLHEASLSLGKGEVIALIGENGSGKSTLIEAISGIIPLRSGDVQWRLENDSNRTVRDSQGRRRPLPPMGLTLQKDGMCGEETVIERIATALSVSGLSHDESILTRLLEEWGLSHRSKSRVAHLSSGLRRRLSVLSGIAPVALSRPPRVSILDEPSEGLDTASKNLLGGWIRAMARNGHGVIIATHDKEVIQWADRVLEVCDSSLKESPGESSGPELNLPKPLEMAGQTPIASLMKWTISMEMRNPVDTVGRAVPAIVAILLAYALVGSIDPIDHGSNLLAALVLAPPFISAVTSPAISRRLSEEDCGRWWNANVGPISRPAFSIIGSSVIIPIPMAYFSWIVLAGSVDSQVSIEVLKWLWLPAICMIDLAIAATSLHLLASDLSRPGAVSASLLLIVLVWPFLELTEALSMIIDNGMQITLQFNGPLVTCFFASLISALVWISAVLFPDT